MAMINTMQREEMLEMVEELKQKREAILGALYDFENLLRLSGAPTARFDSYVKGAIEQATCDFGMHNICMESIIEEIKEHIPEEQYED